MQMFESEAELLESAYLFRITDNGGASCDRFTIVTSDGDYFASSADPYWPQGFFQSGERIDVQGMAVRVEAGEERDLRWIDLPPDVRRAVFSRLNEAFADYLEAAEAPANRMAVPPNDGTHSSFGEGIYRIADVFFVRRESWPADDASDDAGPFATFREAALYTLPQDYSLSGPECHGTVDLADETGGPRELWDCDERESADA